ncbi:MAG: hypothetical protein NZ601_00225, partial [candidate division WOR-3 bacterium]|nr:hypothetical protein [candidate division WOR-3 bacterium]
MDYPCQFNNLCWYRLKVDLLNIRYGPIVKEHPLSIIQAIIKGATTRAFPGRDINQFRILFHIKNKSHTFRLSEQTVIPLEIFFVQMSEAEVNKWLKSFQDYLNDPETGKNFNIINLIP